MADEKEKLVEIQETKVKVKPLFPSNNNLKDNDLARSETCDKSQNLDEKHTSVSSDCKDSSMYLAQILMMFHQMKTMTRKLIHWLMRMLERMKI